MGLAPQPILTASPLVARGQFGARAYGPGEADAQREGYRRQMERIWGRPVRAVVVLPEPQASRAPGTEGAALAAAPPAPDADAEAIARRVAEAHGTTLGALRGPAQTGPILIARQIAMATLHAERPDLNTTAIGAVVGRGRKAVLRALHLHGIPPRRSGAPSPPVRAPNSVTEARA